MLARWITCSMRSIGPQVRAFGAPISAGRFRATLRSLAMCCSPAVWTAACMPSTLALVGKSGRPSNWKAGCGALRSSPARACTSPRWMVRCTVIAPITARLSGLRFLSMGVSRAGPVQAGDAILVATDEGLVYLIDVAGGSAEVLYGSLPEQQRGGFSSAIAVQDGVAVSRKQDWLCRCPRPGSAYP